MKHPIQAPVMVGEVLRFTENAVVSHALEKLAEFGYTLNDLHRDCLDHDSEDWDQFNQLIGYSVSGAPITEHIKESAELAWSAKVSMETARALNAERLLASVRDGMADGVADLFMIHRDDLVERGEG